LRGRRCRGKMRKGERGSLRARKREREGGSSKSSRKRPPSRSRVCILATMRGDLDERSLPRTEGGREFYRRARGQILLAIVRLRKERKKNRKKRKLLEPKTKPFPAEKKEKKGPSSIPSKNGSAPPCPLRAGFSTYAKGKRAALGLGRKKT